MKVQIQPFVDEARNLVNRLAAENKLPPSVIAGRLLNEARKRKARNMDELGTRAALMVLCAELGVKHG